METLTQSSFDLNSRKQVLEQLAIELENRYLHPEKGLVLAQFLRSRSEDAQDADPAMWCKALTQALRKVVPDLHLGVFVQQNNTYERPHAHKGFAKIEFLPGDIAYIDLQGFFPLQEAAPMAVAALQLVQNARALVIDLRKNGGGDAGMVAYLCSFFLPPETHLQTFHRRGSDQVQQSWTYGYLPVSRNLDRPLVVLTSKRTGSAAEEFSYNLKALKRATLIGENTAGAGHTADFVDLPCGLGAIISTGHPLSPHTGGHWEGVGVEPDIAVPADQALERALAFLQTEQG